jgi:hypothetical protein
MDRNACIKKTGNYPTTGGLRMTKVNGTHQHNGGYTTKLKGWFLAREPRIVQHEGV